MPRKKTSDADRLAQLEADLTDLKIQLAALATQEEIDAMRDDVDVLRAELRARGVDPKLPNPAFGRSKREPDIVSAIRARNAAAARASKEVGPGQGKVRTKATQAKLRRQAKADAKRRKKP